jgi:mannitol-specific phosphotransferase system IIBC component
MTNNSNNFQIVLLLIVTIILSIFIYLINDKTNKTTEDIIKAHQEVQNIKKETNDFKIRYQTLKKVNDSIFLLIDKQNIKIITYNKRIYELEQDEKDVKKIIGSIDDSTLYRILSETPY